MSIYLRSEFPSCPRSQGRVLFLLGTEIAETQKSVETLRDVISARLNATGAAVRQLKCQLNIMGDCMFSVQCHFDSIAGKSHKYTYYLDLAYNHLKTYPVSLVSYKTSLYSAVSSVSSGFAPSIYLNPNQLAAIVDYPTAEVIHRGTKFTSVPQVGFEAT